MDLGDNIEEYNLVVDGNNIGVQQMKIMMEFLV